MHIMVEIAFIFTMHTTHSLVAVVDSVLTDTLSGQCICPGIDLTYECTIMDENAIGTATVWKGTAFDCPETENELTLPHIPSRFTSNTSLGCNNGAIRGRGIRIEENGYTSQVNVTVDSYMDGKTVECYYEGDTQLKTIISNFSIMVTSVPFPPPTDIMANITDVRNGSLQLSLKWTPVAPNCSAVEYIITHTCGSCPNTTSKDTEVVCTDVMIGSQCNFTVQTSVCDSQLLGNISTISLLLKGPDTPLEVNAIPIYSYETGYLTKVMVTFNDLGTFLGLSHSYSINFIDVNSEVLCGSTNISASSCIGGVCKHKYNISLSGCHNLEEKDKTIFVKVSAMNVLGNGSLMPCSQHIEYNYVTLVSVKVNYNRNITILCKFHAQSIELDNSTTNYTCCINYGQQQDKGTSHSSVVTLNIQPIQGRHQNFTIIATNGTHTAWVEGRFNISSIKKVTAADNLTVIVAIIAPSLVMITLGILVILGIVCFYMKKKLNIDETKSVNEQISANELISNSSSNQMPNIDSAAVGIYSLLQPSEESKSEESKLIYADIGPGLVADGENKPQLFKPLSDDRLEYAQLQHQRQPLINSSVPTTLSVGDVDKSINLDSILIQLREVSQEWYKFGFNLGVPEEVMKKYSEYPVDQCMIETVDYWLRHHQGDHRPTWREVAKALEAIEFHQLSAKILEVYVTGRLPIEVDTNAKP